jgi:hypothetical protein
MEELKRCYANFDFDISLLNSEYSSKVNPNSKFNKNLQYLFFWTAKKNEQLYVTDKSLRNNYLSKVLNYQSYIPGVTLNKMDLHYWWGDCSNEKKWIFEKDINSKFTSHYIEKELNISIKSNIGYDKNDLPVNISEYILKKDHGFSGQGVVKDVNQINYPILIEEKLNRKEDYGTIICDEDQHTFRNLVDRHGQYVGSFLNQDKYICQDIKEDLDSIYIKYKEKYNVESLQIDSFSYFKGEDVFYRPLCEVNHRKSMGWVTNKLKEKFGSNFSFFLIIHKHKTLNLSEDISQYDTINKEGLIHLSLLNEALQTFFITSNSKSELKEYLVNTSKYLKDPKELRTFISSI